MGGEADGFDAWCRQEWPQLVSTLRWLCRDASVAEELAQEALARAFERWDRIGRLESPGGWAHRVAVNLATSWWRRERVAARWRSPISPEPAESDTVRDEVREAVLALPMNLRVAVVLRFYLDWSVAQTAQALHLTPGAVRARTHRAYASLRRQLTHLVEREDMP